MDDYPQLETTITNLKKEQNSDRVMTKVTKWLETNSTPSANIYSTGKEQKYLKQFRRLFIENGLLYRRYFAHDGTILYKQLCVPKTILKEIMYRIHNSPTGGHLGFTRTTEEFRKICPNYVEIIADYIRNCSTCLQIKQIQPSKLRKPLQEVSTFKSFPGHLMQIDILGPFPSPYKYVLTSIDVFSKYLFAVPLTKISAVSVATALVSIMFQHSYIPQDILSDLGTPFVSDLFHELNRLLDIKISHASLKHP